MADRTVDDQLTKYLTDVHSIEVQALAQLEAAPGIAADSRLSGALEQHLEETRDQERRVRDALDARGVDTSTLKDLAGRDIAVTDRILVEERAAAERIGGTWDAAIEAGLEKVGVRP